MFKTELINASNSERRSVSFFEDDTIETVRQQIAKSIDIHQDRLFILVACRYSRNYYLRDPRHWETLFHRLSLNGMPIQRETFGSYISTYRIPNLTLPYASYDLDTWMSYPEELRDIFEPSGDFTEYRILGVQPLKSYCLPIEFDAYLASRIPPAQSPIPDNSLLFLSLYEAKDVKGFLVKSYESGAEGSYFPLFRATTPQRLSDDQISKLDTNSKHLEDLLSLDPPTPTSIHILKASWFLELVDTDFGNAVGTRFEQIFYGLTVSKEVPCITYFTGRTDVSRHKFYTEDTKSKKPYLEIPVWNAWWSKSKPPRNRPTLVLYSGDDRDNYDRVSISSSDISFAVYRTNTNKLDVEELQTRIKKWFMKFDAIIPFIKSSDIADCRWILQDIRFEAKYSTSLDELDTRRMNCISSIFDESKKDRQVFRFLRTDYVNDGITPLDLQIINILKDSPFLKASELEEPLRVTPQEAVRLLQQVQSKIEEDPGILSRQYRGFPALIIKPDSIEVNADADIYRPLKYINILRYILSNPSSKQLDTICPKRVETVEASTVSLTNTSLHIDDSFGDLFGYAEEDAEVEPDEVVESKPTSHRIKKNKSSYRYFYSRLQQFDPETFDPSSKYPKKCEKSHQPVILSDSDLQEMLKKDESLDLSVYNEKQKLEVNDPHGIVLCPDYWCIQDEIPLQETQLKLIDGEKTCPICRGKLRDESDTKSDIREFSVIKRTKGFSYPGLLDDLSPKNQRNLPCCFKTARTRKIIKDDSEGKYYVLDETKTGLDPLRFAYLPIDLLKSLQINETYSLIQKSSKRIQAGMSGFFRVGLGRPSVSLFALLNIDKTILSPRENIEWILRCSFLSTWTKTSDRHVDEITTKLKEFKPFSEDMIARTHVAKLIASIDEDFENGTLSVMQELEYTAIVLRTDIFRINLDTQTVGCTFYTLQSRIRTRGIIVLQRGNEIDCLCHVVRIQKKFEYRANIFESPFKKETSEELIGLRREACKLSIPTFAQAAVVLHTLAPEHMTDFSVILDPFGRGQAIYVEKLLILPFQNTPIPPIQQSKINGYSDIRDALPEYSRMKTFLVEAAKVYSGYTYEQDIHDADYNTVEILTKSGLRIPIQPFRSIGENEELLQTVSQHGETELVFGQPNSNDVETYKTISYASEVYEFLIFQLTADIHLSEYEELLLELQEPNPRQTDLEEPLQKWFDETTYFHSITEPIEFLSKIRTPCGQFKTKNVCENAHMCGWNKNSCNIEVRDTVSKTKLFNKLLGTLVDNSKIRSMILDGRTTPFFSTILYLELPTEIILTDYQLKQTNE